MEREEREEEEEEEGEEREEAAVVHLRSYLSSIHDLYSPPAARPASLSLAIVAALGCFAAGAERARFAAGDAEEARARARLFRDVFGASMPCRRAIASLTLGMSFRLFLDFASFSSMNSATISASRFAVVAAMQCATPAAAFAFAAAVAAGNAERARFAVRGAGRFAAGDAEDARARARFFRDVFGAGMPCRCAAVSLTLGSCMFLFFDFAS